MLVCSFSTWGNPTSTINDSLNTCCSGLTMGCLNRAPVPAIKPLKWDALIPRSLRGDAYCNQLCFSHGWDGGDVAIKKNRQERAGPHKQVQRVSTTFIPLRRRKKNKGGGMKLGASLYGTHPGCMQTSRKRSVLPCRRTECISPPCPGPRGPLASRPLAPPPPPFQLPAKAYESAHGGPRGARMDSQHRGGREREERTKGGGAAFKERGADRDCLLESLAKRLVAMDLGSAHHNHRKRSIQINVNLYDVGLTNKRDRRYENCTTSPFQTHRLRPKTWATRTPSGVRFEPREFLQCFREKIPKIPASPRQAEF